ncbi:hypothetical protein I3760_16G032700 [Carya illinoinensis]|nr:hypothetical protein I3760_16G032700 [Carya illinoinensis]
MDRNSQTVSSLSCAALTQTPWLMLPSDQEDDSDDARCFFSLAENKTYKIENVFDGLPDAWCVGSSHGWMVVLDQRGNPRLFNTFCKAKVELPAFPRKMKPNVGETYFIEQLRKIFIVKAVVLFMNQYSCRVVVIYGIHSRLAFCTLEDNTWTGLGDEGYRDIICYENQLYNGSIAVWDFRSPFPTKIIRPSAPVSEVDHYENFPRNKFFTQSYLVESMGGLLLVDRIVGYFVNSEGIAVDEYDLLSPDDTHPLVCPYRTKVFNIYKLDHKQETWKKVESLGDRVIFVGGNYSISFSIHDLEGCESNAIYFSDDNWKQDEDYLYGGHDFGTFNLTDGSFETTDYCSKFDPPPFWIIPAPRR